MSSMVLFSFVFIFCSFYLGHQLPSWGLGFAHLLVLCGGVGGRGRGKRVGPEWTGFTLSDGHTKDTNGPEARDPRCHCKVHFGGSLSVRRR